MNLMMPPRLETAVVHREHQLRSNLLSIGNYSAVIARSVVCDEAISFMDSQTG